MEARRSGKERWQRFIVFDLLQDSADHTLVATIWGGDVHRLPSLPKPWRKRHPIQRVSVNCERLVVLTTQRCGVPLVAVNSTNSRPLVPGLAQSEPGLTTQQ